MLAKVLQMTLIKQTDLKKPEENEGKELWIINSFCTVAIVDHDIVAVATKTRPGVSIITCNHLTNETDLSPQVSISQVWDLLFTKNSCRSDPKPPNPVICPIIIKPTAPAGIDPKNSREVVDYYLKNPQWVLYYILTMLNTLLMYISGVSNSEVILPQHLWMLTRILTVNPSIIFKPGHQSEAKQQMEHLLHYIVATCYPKLLCHINNQVSQSYI